jgi:hypothetical protein
MNNEKECLCGSPKRREQNWCSDCDEGLSKCNTSQERMEFYLKKSKQNQKDVN